MKLTIEKGESAPDTARSSFLWLAWTMAPSNRDPETALPELRQKITGLVARNAVAMVQCAIDGVMEEGQYQAIKYLFEMVGIYPASAGADDAPEDTLSKVLLRRLGVDESGLTPGSGQDTQIHPVE